MESGFSVGGIEFKLNKIDAFKQLHIVRRVGPILGDLLPAMKNSGLLKGGVKNVESLPEEEKLAVISDFLTPIFTGLSKLTDEDTEIVLLGLLNAVEMKQPAGNWARVSDGKMLMFQNLELPVLINLAGRAFMFNLTRFFSALPQ